MAFEHQSIDVGPAAPPASRPAVAPGLNARVMQNVARAVNPLETSVPLPTTDNVVIARADPRRYCLLVVNNTANDIYITTDSTSTGRQGIKVSASSSVELTVSSHLSLPMMEWYGRGSGSATDEVTVYTMPISTA